MMFSFLSNWRQTFSSSDGDSDDVSSLNRSLSLPWPVTESSPRKNKNEGNQTQQLQQLRQQPVNGMNVRDISYPIPKMALKSLTRPDDHLAAGLPGPSAPPATIDGTIGTPSLHPFIAAPAPISESIPWFHESAERRKNNNYNLRTALLQANAYAQHVSTTSNASAPPEVIRLDNNFPPDVEARSQPPTTVYHHETSLDHHASSYPYATHPYANGISNSNLYANPCTQQIPHIEDDEHEIYASPFGHSDEEEDAFFRGPVPKQTITTASPASRWGGLKLHTASPFSQSTVRVDGLVLPPPNTSSHHTVPLSAAAGVLSSSLQSETPPLPTVNTDVYNQAYNYPLAKQLSPIAEQDYFSPISVRGLPASAASASPGAESVLNFGFGNGNGRTTVEGDNKDKDRERDWERGSVRTRSVRAGSVGSAKAPATSVSRSGSLSMSMREGSTTRDPNPSPSSGSTFGSEIPRPSPIYASPFITRHLNRTISQTSSNKSESPSQAQFQPPPPPPPPPPLLPIVHVLSVTQSQPQSQPQIQGVTQCNAPSTLSRITSQLSMGSISSTPRLSTVTITPANAYLKLSAPDTTNTTTGSVHTPTSAATTTTGTMYSPSSAFPVPTPTSPTSATTGIQIPTPAITILPCIPPLDFRPFFPGPHPSLNLSNESEVPRLRPPKIKKKRGDAVYRLSVIRGSGIQTGTGDMFAGDEEEVVDDEDEEEGGGYDVESLHADSFVTATTNSNEDEAEDNDEDDDENNEKQRGVELTILAKGKSASVHSTRSQLPSATISHSGSVNSTTGDSFITRRWDRDAALGLSLSPTTFRERKHQFFNSNSSFITNLTPAFWAFWLGFLFPVLWFVGGWHFTNLGEQPPKSTVWEWYFWRMGNGWGGFGWWKRVLAGWWCCGIRKGGRSVENDRRGSGQQPQHVQIQIQTQQGSQRRIPPTTRPRMKSLSYSHSKLRSGKVFPALPRWVAEKQTSDDGRMRLNDPKRSLKGISFGYPFISRPPYSQGSTLSSSTPASPSLSVARKVLIWAEKPNRVLDQLHGVKLREVRGRPESGRRMFDPWIQRCRYAFCWMMLALAIGLCTTSVYLIVVNTRRL